MNQIQEKDWAEDDWGWHSGMKSDDITFKKDKMEKSERNISQEKEE